jgi:hypothetical protein
MIAEGGIVVIALSIIILCGYALYVLLAPPAELFEETQAKELMPELKISSINLPEYSKIQISGKEE